MSNKKFKKPNIKGPRFRPEVYQVMSKEFFKEFRKKYPKYEDLSDPDLRRIGKKFNNILWENVIENRDGVQLPEGLGNLFIGTCQASKKKNINFGKSQKYGVTVSNNNWSTDGKLAKIFYTSYASKYKFINRECWTFNACRNFKRALSKSYPENWTMYVEVDPIKKLKTIFQKTTRKHTIKDKIDHGLDNYNEFDI